jgi:hypothetical protein
MQKNQANYSILVIVLMAFLILIFLIYTQYSQMQFAFQPEPTSALAVPMPNSELQWSPGDVNELYRKLSLVINVDNFFCDEIAAYPSESTRMLQKCMVEKIALLFMKYYSPEHIINALITEYFNPYFVILTNLPPPSYNPELHVNVKQELCNIFKECAQLLNCNINIPALFFEEGFC